MRLWHYKLLPYLPKSQLLAQWRELNSIFKKQDNHILINYLYEYPKEDFISYSSMVIKEMQKRKYKVDKSNYENYFGSMLLDEDWVHIKYQSAPFKNHHNDRYLIQCFFNLEEKYDRGQKDFSKKQYDKLNEFVWNEIYITGEKHDKRS